MVLVGTIATPSGSELPGGGDPVAPTVSVKPIQVAGLVPLTECDAEECRSIDVNCCYILPVFGNTKPSPVPPFSDIPVDVPTYENDFNAWTVDYTQLAKNNATTITWILEKVVDGEWTEFQNPLNNDYGRIYPILSIPGHKFYARLELNWGAVLFYKGAGCYRIKVESSINIDDPTGLGPSVSVITSCLVSPCFELLTWDCVRAHGTVKFETNMGGKIGDHGIDYLMHDHCGLTLYDSVRFGGFLGYETSPEYKEVIQEYQTGLRQTVRNEQIQEYTLNTKPLPKWLHDRFKTYGLMADTCQASDYNRNNSDYDIKRKAVKRASAYEPTWYDRNFLRLGKVTVKLVRGVQSVIKTSCCCADGGPIDP